MKLQHWKGNPLKALSTSKRRKSAGRNSSGMITVFHRGGGSKRLLRRIDFKRNATLCAEQSDYQTVLQNTAAHLGCEGVVKRIEYDPNRSSRIALISWSSAWNSLNKIQSASTHSKDHIHDTGQSAMQQLPNVDSQACALHSKCAFNAKVGIDSASNKLALALASGQSVFTYILAYDQMAVGDRIVNVRPFNNLVFANNEQNDTISDVQYQTIGNCVPLHLIPIGTLIHNIELNPDQGGKLVRSAGTFAHVVQQSSDSTQCIVRLPSGIDKQINSQCRATIGIVSNVSHSTRKLLKAGNTRWLGKRPVVRGVAMNPVDHPHGGGEGRTKGGRPSVSPWGKPTKGGFKTAIKTKA